MPTRSVVVVGGGVGGLSAALAAARGGHPVTLCESGSLAPERVCGEFLSPEILEDLAALGCGDALERLGAVPLRRLLVVSPRGKRVELEIADPPPQALTRRALEQLLVERARDAGVLLLERARVRSVEPSRGGGWRWSTRASGGEADLVIHAFGKCSALDGALALPRAKQSEPFAARKAYFSPAAPALEADVELYLVPGGYVGLNPVEGGRVGLCALLSAAEEPPRSFGELGPYLGAASAPLRRRLEALGPPLGPVRGLTGFGFGPQRVADVDALAGASALFVGDAARMLPPFSGDGIAAALRTGRLAAAAAAAAQPASAYRTAYASELGGRLRVAALLHRAFLLPGLFDALSPLARIHPAVPARLYSWTRGRLRAPVR